MPAFHIVPTLTDEEKKRLTHAVPNPKFVQYVRMYRRSGNAWKVPLGVRPPKDCTSPPHALPAALYGHQRGAIAAALCKSYGLLHLSVGSGKTYIALLIAHILGKPTVILVPRAELVKQFIADANKFGVPLDSIKIRTWQSITSQEKLNELTKECKTLIVDEVHTLATPLRISILFSFSNAERCYFMTGTPERTDKFPLRALTGPTLFTHTPTFYTPEVHVHPFETHLGFPDGENWYTLLQTQLSEHERRNAHIARVARLYEDRHILILCKRVAHSEILQKMIPDSAVAIAGEPIPDAKVIIGTLALLSTGINQPQLSVVIFAGDLKSRVLAEQGAGRCLRYLFSKPGPIIVDIPDPLHPVFRKQFKERYAVYEKKGWSITSCELSTAP